MSIKKSADGYFRTTVMVDGKRHTVAGRTEAEAYRKAGKLKHELETGVKLEKAGKTVAEFTDEWIETYHSNGTPADAIYKQIARDYIVPIIGNKRLKDVTEKDLQSILNNNGHFSKSSLMKLRVAMKQMFSKAQRNKLIIDNPAEFLTLPPCSNGTHRTITDEERELILKVAETNRGGLYIKIMLYCGLRPGEVDALQWDCVDLEKKFIHVRKAVKRDGTIGTTKSRAGIRDIPIPAALLPDLRTAKASGSSEFVCPNTVGKHYTMTERNFMWHQFRRKMDLLNGAETKNRRIVKSTIAPDLTLYCLRHTYCTDLQRAGVPINVAKTLMGHSSIQMTANIYTHTSDADTIEAIGNLDKYLASLEEEEQSNVIQFPSALCV